MPFISSKDVATRLESPDNLKNKVESLINKGDSSSDERASLLIIHEREKHDQVNLPIEIRKTVALLATDHESEESHQGIANAFGIDRTTVTRSANGEVAYRTPSEELKETVAINKGKRADAETKAIDSVLKALEIIPSKINENTKLKDLNQTIKSLSQVANQMNPSIKEMGDGAQVHLHIYRPQMKKVEDYEAIDV